MKQRKGTCISLHVYTHIHTQYHHPHKVSGIILLYYLLQIFSYADGECMMSLPAL